MKLLPLPKIDLIQHRLTIEQKLGESRKRHDELIDELNKEFETVQRLANHLHLIENAPSVFLKLLYHDRSVEAMMVQRFGVQKTVDEHKFYRHE